MLNGIQELLVICELSFPVGINALPAPFDHIRASSTRHNELGIFFLGTRVLRRMGPL